MNRLQRVVHPILRPDPLADTSGFLDHDLVGRRFLKRIRDIVRPQRGDLQADFELRDSSGPG